MKKLIAILISVVMLFSLTATPALAGLDRSIFSARSVSTLEETTADSDSDGVLGQHKDEVNLFIKLFDELYESFHNFIHFFVGVFGADCPMCDGEDNETPDETTTEESTTDETTTEEPTTEEPTTEEPTTEEPTTEEPTTEEPKPTVPVVKNVEEFREAVSEGGKLELAEDIVVDEAIDSNDGKGYTSIINATKDIDIDLNGHTISQASGVDCDYGIYAVNGATVNIYDSSEDSSGVLNAYHKEGAWTVYAGKGATVNIYGGTFITNNDCLIYKQTYDATINIYGGSFMSTVAGNVSALINCKNGTGVITIYGGSFKGFKPGVDNSSEAVLAEGLIYETVTVDTETWYNVIPESK